MTEVKPRNKIRTFTADTLPAATAFAAGTWVSVTGNFAPDCTKIAMMSDGEDWHGWVRSTTAAEDSVGVPDGVDWVQVS